MSAIETSERAIRTVDTTTRLNRKGFGLLLVNDGKLLTLTRPSLRAVGHDAHKNYAQLPQGEYDGRHPVETLRLFMSETFGLDGRMQWMQEMGIELTVDTLTDVFSTAKGWQTMRRDWLLFRLAHHGSERVRVVRPELGQALWLTPQRLLEQCQPFRRDNYGKVIHYFDDHLAGRAHLN